MFDVTDRAKSAIKKHLSENSGELIPMITWSCDEGPKDGSWVVMFADKGQLMNACSDVRKHVQRRIADMDFIVDGPAHWENLLEGRVLDFRAGQFVFTPPASHPSA